MQPLLDVDIRDQIGRYLAGDIALNEFHEWVMSQAWRDEELDPLARRLINRIQLRLAEHSSGHWSEEELRARLWPLFGRSAILLSAILLSSETQSITTASRSVTILGENPVQPVDIIPSRAYA